MQTLILIRKLICHQLLYSQCYQHCSLQHQLLMIPQCKKLIHQMPLGHHLSYHRSHVNLLTLINHHLLRMIDQNLEIKYLKMIHQKRLSQKFEHQQLLNPQCILHTLCVHHFQCLLFALHHLVHIQQLIHQYLCMKHQSRCMIRQ